MINLVENEWFKMFKSKKIYVFMAIILIHEILTVYFYKFGGNVQSIIVTPNGQSLPLTLISPMAQLMTIFITVYVADLITHEYQTGTWKLLLLRPISRLELLNSKIIVLLIFIATLVAFSVVSAYAVGTFIFGWGDYTVYGDLSYKPWEGLWMTILLTSLTILPYMACGMVCVYIAVLSDNRATTLIFSIGFLMAAQYLSAMEQIKLFSVIHQMYFFQEYFSKSSNWNTAILSTIVVFTYMTIFYILSISIIRKKGFIF